MAASEIELKLRVRPEDLRRLAAMPMLGHRGTTRTLETVYFDTPDLQLRQAGAVLRVRRDGRRYLQSVKSSGAGAALQRRDEREVPLAGATPDPAQLQRRFPRLAADELRPVFVSRVRRTIRRVDGIEVALDSGEIRTPEGAAEPVSEVELELKSGKPSDVFALALALAETVPVALETRTKSDRGYALAGKTPASAIHALPLELAADATAAEAIGAILRRCLDHLTANQALALEAGDAGSVHQMRVALRRIRSACALLRALLPASERKAIAAEAKWLAGVLGAARDHDVFLSETLAPVRAAFADDAGLARLEEAAEAALREAQAALRAALESQRYTRFVLRLGAFIENERWEGEESAAAVAARLLEKRAREAKRTGKGFRKLDVAQLHELRIALKKLRYAAEFFRSLFPARRARPYLKRLAALQTGLGRINDLETAQHVLDGLVASAPPDQLLVLAAAAGRVVGWHAHALAGAEAALVAEWRGFVAARPFWA